jgi:hypothetical protein
MQGVHDEYARNSVRAAVDVAVDLPALSPVGGVPCAHFESLRRVRVCCDSEGLELS